MSVRLTELYPWLLCDSCVGSTEHVDQGHVIGTTRRQMRCTQCGRVREEEAVTTPMPEPPTPPEPNLAVVTVLELEAARGEVVTGGNGHAVDATADTLPPPSAWSHLHPKMRERLLEAHLADVFGTDATTNGPSARHADEMPAGWEQMPTYWHVGGVRHICTGRVVWYAGSIASAPTWKWAEREEDDLCAGKGFGTRFEAMAASLGYEITRGTAYDGEFNDAWYWTHVGDKCKAGPFASAEDAAVAALCEYEQRAQQTPAPAPPVCRCGSGGHPRRCAAHPDEFDRHCAELSALAREDEPVAPLREHDAGCARRPGHDGRCWPAARSSEPVAPTTRPELCDDCKDATAKCSFTWSCDDVRRVYDAGHAAAQAELATLREQLQDARQQRDSAQQTARLAVDATLAGLAERDELRERVKEMEGERDMYKRDAHQSAVTLVCERQAREALQAKVDALCEAIDAIVKRKRGSDRALRSEVARGIAVRQSAESKETRADVLESCANELASLLDSAALQPKPEGEL
jgi:hypothetical protein